MSRIPIDADEARRLPHRCWRSAGIDHFAGAIPSAMLTAAMLQTIMLAGCRQANSYIEPPPPKVSVARPVRRPVTSYAEYTGTTQAVARVELRARVKGFLKKRLFKEGARVKEGELLLVIEEESFRVQLDQASARLAEAESALRKAEQSMTRQIAGSQVDLDQAQLVLSQIDETRSRALFSRKASSREDMDKAEATRKKNEAQVESDRASLKQAEADYEINILAARSNVKAATAMVRNAELDLGYCQLRAPISGTISRVEVDEGNLVGDGQATLLATIVKTDQIYATMYVSEDNLLRARKAAGPGAGKELPLELGLGDEEGYPHEGHVDYTDPGVDPGTGTIRVRGVFPNPNGEILPGLFVRVRAAIGVREDALLVPAKAIGYDQAGEHVLVLAKNNIAERRAVRPGETVGDLRVIEGKVAPEDLVIIDNLVRVRPELPVDPLPVPEQGLAASARPVEAGSDSTPASAGPTTEKTSRP